MKHTLTSKFGAEVSQISTPHLPEEEYKNKLKLIHTTSVARSINLMAQNKVLLAPLPQIDLSERKLPRQTRATLAQLRSGYSNYLNSYKARIDNSVQDKCPSCDQQHTTAHLFTCVNNLTTLNVKDLWFKPIEDFRFLNLPSNENEINDDYG